MGFFIPKNFHKMLTRKVRRVYNAAREDEEFLTAIKEAARNICNGRR